MPCFQGGRTCPGKKTGALDSGPTQAAASTSVIPKASFPVVSKEAAPSSQTDGPATTPETSKPTRSSPSRRRVPKSPAPQHNVSGSRIRKIHDSHRGGFRRSPRLQPAQSGLANKGFVSIDPVPSRDRPGPAPSPLKQCDNTSNSEQPAALKAPAAPLRPGRPRRQPNNETTPQGTGSSLALSGSTGDPEKAAAPPAKIACDCLSSALRLLEDLETQNYHLQDYSGPAISQPVSQSLAKCVEILRCKICSERSEQMVLMVIIAQKITKMFSRLTTRLIEGGLLISSAEKAVPLPRLLLIQQLKLEKALDQLKTIAREKDWKIHLAMLAPICQYSKDTMDRLRRMNGNVVIQPRLALLNKENPIITNKE